MRKLEKMPSLANVAAGAVATLNLPVGLTYDLIQFVYSGVTLAQMTNIEVRINGKTVQFFQSGTELDYINQYYGRGAAAGILNLWFVRPEMNLVEQQRFCALGTADVQTLSVHIEIDSGAAAPVITAYALRSGKTPLGVITKVKAFPVSFATSGQQEIDNIPRSGARIGAIHLFKSDVSNVEVEVDSIKIVDASKTLIHELQTRHGRTPQTAVATHVDWLLDGDFFQSLQTAGVQDMRIRPTIGAAGALRAVVEYFDGLEGI